MPRYSASVLDREIVGWRFEDHEMMLSPVKMQYPEVDRLESGQPPQSASEYAVRAIEDHAEMCMPNPIVP
ncbi:hypothetical protein HanLR1_Chr14g0536141 [Helianthus annuus]|nr:hypothetical protein HanHA89_Chr14g0573741 [Helianthus annuus]KAJ0656468.1 hypothetical protein HanLR1_Chr14g0536141 [Helianthus annuus]